MLVFLCYSNDSEENGFGQFTSLFWYVSIRDCLLQA
ncbi:unnamed protein product [Brugia timori]|uniref:Uncharacterized protein n=1 Tax=Brugia timori TaxID=42155 RepID=A0A0R3R0C0_9BILA|nr:unnamed protein product [Brugia timori]